MFDPLFVQLYQQIFDMADITKGNFSVEFAAQEMLENILLKKMIGKLDNFGIYRYQHSAKFA